MLCYCSLTDFLADECTMHFMLTPWVSLVNYFHTIEQDLWD
jgi:hypothetical protein